MNENSIPQGAISIYNQNDAMDDFPVLKAFQQYIDAEQAKARKRLISMGIFFGILMGAVIAVFVVMLLSVTQRNQALNDRLIEFAMQDRKQHQAAVVVQPSMPQDNSAIVEMSNKFAELKKQLETRESEIERKAKEEAEKKAREEAAAAAEKAKAPSPQDLEIARLRALLAEQKEKQKEAELEAYRRKHYPDLYAPKSEPVQQSAAKPARKKAKTRAEEIDEVMEALEELDDDAAISYFDGENEDDDVRPAKKNRRRTPSRTGSRKNQAPVDNDYYSIPVEIRGTQSNWSVPND
jgi:chemotaxis protein histidine kinase CheA